ncbi:zinc finger MYM-type protein 1-like [Asparagus officinalis]|uniref:zinc finger MYM-type protein 1-like n=1 Tax=Asparagus officinalis TaxID=4686 RepID=UPI00098E0B70|nr:zinc finger MYM-type protein 1-like [Asparagus officinalis]
MGKSVTIDKFFQRKRGSELGHAAPITPSLASNDNDLPSENPPKRFRNPDGEEVDLNSLERDPGLRRQIWEYPLDQREEIRRAYLNLKAYQPILQDYPLNKDIKHPRRFQFTWYELFHWLEYSPAKDKAYCFPCFLFNKPSGCKNQTAFVVDGFDSWKKVRSGKACAFLGHIGKDNVSSLHRNAEKACEDLMNQPQHISRRFDNFNAEQIATNRLRLRAHILVVRLLALQGITFRGHDEKSSSSNRGNFLEFLDVLAMENDELSKAIAKAPKNAKYTSHDIQKQILHVFSVRLKNAIREEIGVAKYCIIVDEARDESKKEQMSIVLRFVDTNGFIQERFFGIVHVSDTAALTLKNAIYSALAYYNLDVQNIRGQGYDGASNMRGEFNGLQALIMKDCKTAYYVHCFAHRLQLALVAAAKNLTPIHMFFDKLISIVNMVGASCKRNDELKKAHADDIAHLISNNELETVPGLNQIGTLQRATDTRWSSHFRSLSSLIRMFSAACTVLLKVMEDGLPSQRADATSVYDEMTSFDFVFILHLMSEIMGITDFLCQTLQRKSQDISNAMELVASTKRLLQELRDDKWDNLLEKV